MKFEPEKKFNVDDVRDTVHTFMDKISIAKLNGDEFIETSDEIIRHYNRNGTGMSDYFYFQGVRVYHTVPVSG